MFNIKKVIATILTIALFLASTATTQAFASSQELFKEPQTYEEITDYLKRNANTEVVEIKEIDYLKQLQALQAYSKEELVEAGYTEKDAEEIIDYDFNEELLKFTQKPVDEFKAMGYTNSQIKKFREYDGTIDAIEYLEINALSSATLTVSWLPLAALCNRNQFRIIYNTEWNTSPMITAKDMIAIAWVAADSFSNVKAMKYDEAPTLTVKYYDGWNNLVYSPTLSANSLNHTSLADFDIAMSMQQALGWAKFTAGSIKVSTQSNSNNIETIAFVLCYGHTVITLGSPSLSIDISGQGSLSISPSWQTENTYNVYRVYKYDGNLISEIKYN